VVGSEGTTASNPITAHEDDAGNIVHGADEDKVIEDKQTQELTGSNTQTGASARPVHLGSVSSMCSFKLFAKSFKETKRRFREGGRGVDLLHRWREATPYERVAIETPAAFALASVLQGAVLRSVKELNRSVFSAPTDDT
jgi:hypothetical protein